jgi:APA family basic amino acid/polyamine antiporter
VPISGSAYTYSYATLGELVAWIIGWDLILEYAVGAAAVSIGWSGYFVDLLKSIGITIPKAFATSPFSGGIINLPAVIIILLITGLLILGTSESARVNSIIVIIKLLVIVFFLVIGFGHINAANWSPFLPFGVGGIFRGASIIFFAYIGFDQISTSAEEARNPARDLPIGIFVSLLVCTVLYILVTLVLTGVVSYTKLNVASPVSHALILLGLNAAGSVISVGAIAGLTTVLLVLLFGQSRIFFSMSRDGLLPGLFSRVHLRFRTPYLSTLLVGIVVAAVAGLTPIDVVAELTNIGTLAAFVLVAAAVLILRRTQPNLRRGYRVPFVPVIPILSIIASFVLIVSLPWITLVRFVVWLAIGLVIYFVYSRRSSHLQKGTVEPAGDKVLSRDEPKAG